MSILSFEKKNTRLKPIKNTDTIASTKLFKR